MAVEFSSCLPLLHRLGITVRGILHIGACVCEERESYHEAGLTDDNIYWVEGNRALVKGIHAHGIPHVSQALLADEEKEVLFHIASNRASSSILELGTHAESFKEITYIGEFPETTLTLEHLIERDAIPIERLNYWCLDVQGSELAVLRGAGAAALQHADAILCEVNYEEVYKKCGLLADVDAFLLAAGFLRLTTNLALEGSGNALYARQRTPRASCEAPASTSPPDRVDAREEASSL